MHTDTYTKHTHTNTSCSKFYAKSLLKKNTKPRCGLKIKLLAFKLLMTFKSFYSIFVNDLTKSPYHSYFTPSPA